MTEPEKVLVIGASGMVGMATIEALQKFTNAEIIAYDRPLDETDSSKRFARKEAYQNIQTKRDQLLDQQHADWITRDWKSYGQKNDPYPTTDLNEALKQHPACIAITAGVSSTNREEFNKLIEFNAPYFVVLGKNIVDAYVASLKENPNYGFPVVVNTSNPIDTLTELLLRAISSQLKSHIKENLRTDPELALQLAAQIKKLPQKILGQGGLLDGCRAAFAINEKLDMPLNDISLVPVVGPHDIDMAIDFDNIAMKQGDTPKFTEAQKQHINHYIRHAALNVLNDTYSKTGIKHGAIFATAAAVTCIIKSVIEDAPQKLCASIYDPRLDRCFGSLVTIDQSGARFANNMKDASTYNFLYKGKSSLDEAFHRAQQLCGSDQLQRSLR